MDVLHHDLEAVEASCLGDLDFTAEPLDKIFVDNAITRREESKDMGDKVAFITDRRFLETVCLLVPQNCLADIRFFGTSQLEAGILWASLFEAAMPVPAKSEIFLPQVPGF